MSKLIQLRQRIKAIETIKKITHAMRLIAMSSHSQLKNKQSVIQSYTHELEAIIAQVTLNSTAHNHPILYPPPNNRVAVIIIGSQKGLCGSFNTYLFKKTMNTLKSIEQFHTIHIIPVGKKAIDFTDTIGYPIMQRFDKIAISRIQAMAYEIASLIVHTHPNYQSVIVISNHFNSFFLQRPHVTHLIPYTTQPTDFKYDLRAEITWEQSPDELLHSLVMPYLTAKLHLLLFDSILAEQAARFISMDSATRNANILLDMTRLEYNKARQAKITKELTELSSSYR